MILRFYLFETFGLQGNEMDIQKEYVPASVLCDFLVINEMFNHIQLNHECSMYDLNLHDSTI